MPESGGADQSRAAGEIDPGLRADRGALAIGAVCLLSLFIWVQPGLTLPDGAGYYVYLPSTWIDGDLLFYNEWQRLGMVRDGVPMFKSATDTGHLSNHWTVGPALLWFPYFLVGDLTRALIPSFRHFHRDGVVLPYNLAVIVASTFAGLATLLIGYRLARRWFSERDAVTAALATWFGTTLLWYSVRDAAMSHAVSAFACAAVVWLSLRLRERNDGSAALAVGLALGFAALVRIQNAAFLAVPFLILNRDERSLFLRRAPMFIAGGVLGVLPELVVSTILYGNPLGFASIGVRAIGWHPWERFWIAETVFSWYHGLFTWTPLTLLGLIGLIVLRKFDRRLAWTGLLMFAIQWITNSTADRAFWAALSFGARRFDNCTIFFLLGVAAIAAKLSFRIMIVAAATWTMLLFYVARHIDLNAYQSLPELVGHIGSSLRDGFRPLMFIPAPLRSGSAITILACVVALAIGWLAFRAIPVRGRIALVSLYFAATTAALAWAGANGAGRLDHYRPIIERSRAFVSAAGRDIGEQSLYENEIRFLRRTGRHAEAERTAEELREVLRQRAAGLRAAGIQPP